MFSSKDLFFTPAVSGAYTVSKSLRFRSSASAYLSRTPASAGNQKTWTWSAWVKSAKNGGNQILISSVGATPSQNFSYLSFSASTWRNANDTIKFEAYLSNAAQMLFETTPVFRDPSAWYHIVVNIDTTQATSTNRVKIYINGSQITSFTTATYPTQNLDVSWFNTTNAQQIGTVSTGGGGYFDGYLAEVNFIDGQALTPSSFGAYDTNGIWQPAAYTGSYGTNGFYLKFTTVGATSGSNTGYGQDFSGNGNYWTTNNFGTTSTGTSAPSYDSMLDSPTNATGDIGNYCTWNPLSGLTGTLSEANLYFYGPSGYASRMGTIALPTSGKIYFESTLTVAPYTPRGSTSGYNWVGVALTTNFNVTSTPAGNNVNGLMIGDNGYINNFASTSSDTGTTFAVNDIVGFAIDTGANTYTIYKNNVSIASGTINVIAGTSLSPMQVSYDASYGAPKLNFGQRPFIYTPPSGYSPLTTQNLSTPTITNGASYMAAVTYTGTGSSQTITASSTNSGNNPNGTTFQPDFVWAKGRSGATDHALYDAVRGVQLQLESNTTGAETTETTGLTAFTSSGFTTGALAQMNTNTATYVAWEWNAGGSTVTNTTGSISAQVRANTSAGFSVVTYTGNASSGATVGHGLGVTPGMVIVKTRTGGTEGWPVWHQSLSSQSYFLRLNEIAATNTSAGRWTAFSASTITLGGNTETNGSGYTYVAYCFAPVSGYSAFGSYTGNGSTDGPFVYLGFRPRYILFKRTDAIENWTVYDTSRSTYNSVGTELQPWTSGAEATGTLYVDFLSNGFKLRNSNASFNASGGTYIYAAFAENPFKISRAR